LLERVIESLAAVTSMEEKHGICEERENLIDVETEMDS